MVFVTPILLSLFSMTFGAHVPELTAINQTAKELADGNFPISVSIVFHVFCPALPPGCLQSDLDRMIPDHIKYLNGIFSRYNINFEFDKLNLITDQRVAGIPQNGSTSRVFMFNEGNQHIGGKKKLNILLSSRDKKDPVADYSYPALFTDLPQGKYKIVELCSATDSIVFDVAILSKKDPKIWLLAHEIGHWFGLSHTFSVFRDGVSFADVCPEGSDFAVDSPYADDTPAIDPSKNPSSLGVEGNCTVTTCDAKPWVIQDFNMMSYNFFKAGHECRKEFTKNQGLLMRYHYFACRST